VTQIDDLPDDELMHYGIKRKSGRYPWGSGETEYSRSRTFQDMVTSLKAQGVSEKDMAKAMGIKPEVDPRTGKKTEFSITQLRDTITVAKEITTQEETHRSVTLRDKGWSVQAIAKELNISEPTVVNRLKNSENAKKTSLLSTADTVRKEFDGLEHKIIDIGKGSNIDMGISPERFRASLSLLKAEGYETYNLRVKQPGSQNLTNTRVLVPEGTGYSGAMKMVDNIHTMSKWTVNEGRTYLGIHPPISIDSKRLKVVHLEEGGKDQDGVMYVRRDKPDLSMGKNNYAQVRIAVDGTHYLKGMAIAKDDMPPGVDIIFHTNKSKNTPLLGENGVLKPMKKNKDGTIDQANPFGSAISKQIISVDKDGKEKVTSALNIIREEGKWDDWGNSLPSQMLAKQPQPFIRSQLAVTQKQTRDTIAELNSITNPVLRRKLLEKEADKIDSDAVDLRAAAMPGQQTKVILPVPKLGRHEIYAPTFETGEKVVLIRYPHAGRFEIPEVTVNNSNRAAKKLLGNAPDAIGIHPKVAERLSGADFDGDTVIVIPNASGKIRGYQSLGRSAYEFEKGLSGFEPQRQYRGKDEKGDPLPGVKLMKNTGQEMGKITNLITDMSIQGAKPEHIVRAVRHSMVVIDAEKHGLDYRRSEQENGIAQLRKMYQSGVTKDGKPKAGGASTLLSRATAKVQIDAQKARLQQHGGPIDPVTGKRMYEPKGIMKSKFDKKTGTYLDEKVTQKEWIKRLALEDDAHKLVGQNAPVELIYADHVNVMKGIANATRLAAYSIPPSVRNKEAAKVYKPEVDNLLRQLIEAQRLKPLDRVAQRVANENIKLALQEDPTLRYDKDRRNKVERQARDAARTNMGLKKYEMDITDREWDAIQAGAISPTKFREILDGNYVDNKRLFQLALPKTNTVMSSPILSRAKAMLAAGLTNADIARQLGVSPSSLRAALTEGDA
jgi:DNA-binding NarL/FixJ family response regulator